MGDVLMGLGVLLAIIGPLLLIPITWLLYRFVLKPFLGSTKLALPLSILVVAAAMALTYLPGRRAFDRRCTAAGPPVVSEQVNVGGFFRTAMYAYEAAVYLTQDGFDFVEAPDPYRKGVNLRYTKASNGEVRQEEVMEIESLHAVRETYEQVDGGISSVEKVIYEVATGRALGRATQLIYQGGPLSILLGTMGIASCPDPATAQGGKEFQIFYDLESYVLRAKPLP
jgi:hypothetical protein